MYLFPTVPHPHGHWQLQELLGNLNDLHINVYHHLREPNQYRTQLFDNVRTVQPLQTLDLYDVAASDGCASKTSFVQTVQQELVCTVSGQCVSV